MKCDKCKKDFEEKDIHQHHIIPRFFKISNLYSNLPFNINETVYLCKDCHNLIHKFILIPIWDYIPNDWKPCAWQTKLNCCLSIRSFTKSWIKRGKDGDTKKTTN